jgi:hypothetical protein
MVQIDQVLQGFFQQFNKQNILTHEVMQSKSIITLCGMRKTIGSVAVKCAEWIHSDSLHSIQL